MPDYHSIEITVGDGHARVRVHVEVNGILRLELLVREVSVGFITLRDECVEAIAYVAKIAAARVAAARVRESEWED